MAIAYSVKGAGVETGVSEALVREAIRDGELQERYWNTKQIIEHDELVRFVKSLPTTKPDLAPAKKKPAVAAAGQTENLEK